MPQFPGVAEYTILLNVHHHGLVRRSESLFSDIDITSIGFVTIGMVIYVFATSTLVPPFKLYGR